MRDPAKVRGCAPACVVVDSWSAGLATLKAIGGHGWRLVTHLQAHWLSNPDGHGTRPGGACAIADSGPRGHLQGDGVVLVCRRDAAWAWGSAVD